VLFQYPDSNTQVPIQREYNPTLPPIFLLSYFVVATLGNLPRRSVFGEHDMNKLLLASAAALVMTMGAAMAQTSSTQSTTTTIPSVVAPPLGTLSTTHTQSNTGSDGTQTDSKSTTYRNSNGVANDSTTSTTTYPPVASTTTKTNSSTTTTQ
jgi:hypothetical protein